MSRMVPSPPTPMTAATPSASASVTSGPTAPAEAVSTILGAVPSRAVSTSSTLSVSAASVLGWRALEACGLMTTRLPGIVVV